MRERAFCPVFLAQTDTTVGLLSKDKKRLANIKKRGEEKPFLKNVSTYRELKSISRVPSKYKKIIRRKQKTTFIYPNNQAVRVVKNVGLEDFLKRFGWQYSTSANRSGEKFDFNFIKDKVDIIIYTPNGFKEKRSSSLFAVSNSKIRRIR